MAKTNDWTENGGLGDLRNLKLIGAINKKLRGKIAYNLKTGAPTDSGYYIDSGSKMLNYSMTGDPNKGYPSGKLSILWGGQQTGKSLLGYIAIANAQKMGGIGVLFDRENAANPKWMEGLGVDCGEEKLVYVQPRSIEEVFETIDEINAMVQGISAKLGRRIPVCVVWDSVASTPPACYADADYTKKIPGAKALAISTCMERFIENMTNDQLTCIFINQVRNKIGVMFGSPEVMPGGEALPFYASIILKLKKAKALLDTRKVQQGVVVRPKVQKSRFRPTSDEVEVPLIYGQGIQDGPSWIATLAKYEIIAGSGGKYKFESAEYGEVPLSKGTIESKCEKYPNLTTELFARMSAAIDRPVLPGEELMEADLEDAMV
tara:strand:+ start:1425 stop:2552 length:1128 start_codon:yes stop_codon:yes gene_type:complete